MTWYVVAHSITNYPITIYPSKARAERIAHSNGGKVIPVETPLGVSILNGRGRAIPDKEVL